MDFIWVVICCLIVIGDEFKFCYVVQGFFDFWCMVVEGDGFCVDGGFIQYFYVFYIGFYGDVLLSGLVMLFLLVVGICFDIIDLV